MGNHKRKNPLQRHALPARFNPDPTCALTCPWRMHHPARPWEHVSEMEMRRARN